MTQGDSSASSGAGASAAFRDLTEGQKVQLEDADTLVSDQICERLNEAMRADDGEYSAEKYSPEIRDLLRRAWTIAAQFQHREVTTDHIIIGMVTGDESVGALSPSKFAEAGVDQTSLRTRAFAHLGGLATPTALAELPVPTQPVATGVEKWISGAMQIAQARDEDRRDLAPDDLVQIVQNAREPNHPSHIPLQDLINRFYPGVQMPGSAEVSVIQPALGDSIPGEIGQGGQPNAEIGDRTLLTRISIGFEEANKGISSVQHTASRARTEIRRLKTAVDRIPAESDAAEQHLTQLHTHVDEVRRRLADVDGRTTEIKDNQLASLAAAIGDCRSQLADLDRQTAAIQAGLPRPPAAQRVALAIVAVLVLGMACGIALSDPSLVGAIVRLARTAVVN